MSEDPKTDTLVDENDPTDEDLPVEQLNQSERRGLLIIIIAGGILGILLLPSDPIGGFVGGIIWSTGFVILLCIIYIWKESDDFFDAMRQMSQQQQKESSSEQKVICWDCGWKNPATNNYCHDCGEELE